MEDVGLNLMGPSPSLSDTAGETNVLGINVECTLWFKAIQATNSMFEVIQCLRSFIRVCLFVLMTINVELCLFFFPQKVYLAQSCRGISGDIFAYILHPEAYDFVYQRRHSPRYTDSKNCKKL